MSSITGLIVQLGNPTFYSTIELFSDIRVAGRQNDLYRSVSIPLLWGKQTREDISPIEVNTVFAVFTLVGVNARMFHAFKSFQQLWPIFIQAELPEQWCENRQMEKANIPGAQGLAAESF